VKGFWAAVAYGKNSEVLEANNISKARNVDLLFHFIECRNAILNATRNLSLMEKASFCGSRISLLVLDKTRLNVARLVPIECGKIWALAKSFEECLESIIRGAKRGWASRLLGGSRKVSLNCQSILKDLDIAPAADDACNTWRSAVHVLDMAILSYVGAHIQSFGVNRGDSIVLPSVGNGSTQNFPVHSSHDATFQNLSSQWGTGQAVTFQGVTSTWGQARTRIIFRQRLFLCLDEFLCHHSAWVCENWNPDKALRQIENEPMLFLSTDAETFADIWGPMWSSHTPSNPDQVIHYNVGNGKILEWKPPDDSKTLYGQDVTKLDQNLCDIRDSERLCHWISNKSDGLESNLTNSTGGILSPSDILIIGAGAKLQANTLCRSSAGTVKRRLREVGSLHPAGTIKKSRYKESETLQTQVGWNGIGVGLQANFKMRERLWKDVIVEIWKNSPNRRVPGILEFWLGVEVSMCTRNARRQRLITLLGSHTMQQYLNSLSLEWTDPQCEVEFYAALGDPDYTAFRRLWESHVKWRPDLGAAISCCLDVLAETGATEGSLKAFWAPNAAYEYMVTLPDDEHSYAGFLKDSRDACTMVVFSKACLELPKDCRWASSCQSSRLSSQSGYFSIRSKPENSPLRPDLPQGKSLLETSIIINEECAPRGIRCNPYHRRDGSAGTYKECWNVSQLGLGEKFDFGEKGNLKVLEPIGSGQVLATWKSPGMLGTVKRIFSNTHHYEFMGDEELDTRPLDVVILSRNKIQNFGLASQRPSRISVKSTNPLRTGTANASELDSYTPMVPSRDRPVDAQVDAVSAAPSATLAARIEGVQSSGSGSHRDRRR
jgi:hypothetical protein